MRARCTRRGRRDAVAARCARSAGGSTFGRSRMQRVDPARECPIGHSLLLDPSCRSRVLLPAVMCARSWSARSVLAVILLATVASAVEPPDVTVERRTATLRLRTGAVLAVVRLGRYGLRLWSAGSRKLLTRDD